MDSVTGYFIKLGSALVLYTNIRWIRPLPNVLTKGRNKERFMNNIFKTLALGVVLSLLTGCGEPKLDTSSDEAMTASIEKIVAELPLEEQEKFKQAVVGIYLVNAMSSVASGVSADEANTKMNEKLDGKTAKEVFAIANEISTRVGGKK